MSPNGTLHLSWSEFQTNVAESFQSVRQDQEYCDVTLACEGEQLIRAHRVVLSTSGVANHILYKHGDSEEGMKLKIITDNKIQRKMKLSEVVHSNTDLVTVHTDVVKDSHINETDNMTISEATDDVTSSNESVTTKPNYETSSPVWQFAAKLDKTRTQCKLCSKIMFAANSNYY